MTAEQAKAIVGKKFPGYVIGWCVPYKGSYIVMAHPDDGPEDTLHGSYPDPFYKVDKITGMIRPFIPAAESDFGESFLEAVREEFGKSM